MKILDFTNRPFKERQEFLSKEFQIEFVPTPAKFTKKWLQAQKDLSCVLVGPESSRVVLEQFNELPTDVQLLKACDMVEKTEEHWWPRILLTGVLHNLIIERCPKLDTHSLGYVTGSGAHAKMAVGVLFELGYKKINMTAPDLEVLSECIEELRLKHFGVDFMMIQNTELTLQPNNGSILINTIPFSSKEPLLEDLYYLNFVKPNGLVVDLSVLPIKNPLIEEAEHVGTKSLTGAEIQGACDYKLLKRLVLNKELSEFSMTLIEYQVKWMEFLKQVAETIPSEPPPNEVAATNVENAKSDDDKQQVSSDTFIPPKIQPKVQ